MRWGLVTVVAPFVGRFVSNEWVRKQILMQNDEEIEQIDKEIAGEAMDPQYMGMAGAPPEEGGDQEGDQGDAGSAGMVVDPNAMPEPPDVNAASKADKAKDKGSRKPGFKSVGKMLSKGH